MFPGGGSGRISYLDGAYISGPYGKDYVRVGEYVTKAEFMAVTSSDGWWQDGIIGFGVSGGQSSVPEPLMYSLANQDQNRDERTHIADHRAFSVGVGWGSGELHVGGYDPAAIAEPMKWYDARPDSRGTYLRYQLEIEAVTLGGTNLLSGLDPGTKLMGILDSGTSCLLFPQSASDGNRHSVNLWQNFLQVVSELADSEPGLEFTIEGDQYTIPFENFVYLIEDDPEPLLCANSLPNGFDNTLLIGDPLFRALLVGHDLRDDSAPKLGLAPLKGARRSGRDSSEGVGALRGLIHDATSGTPPLSGGNGKGTPEIEADAHIRKVSEVVERDYSIDDELAGGVTVLPMAKSVRSDGFLSRLLKEGEVRASDELADGDEVWTRGYQDLGYYLNMTFGTPEQGPLYLHVDTGSNLMGVFTPDAHEATTWSPWVTVVPVVFGSIALMSFACYSWFSVPSRRTLAAPGGLPSYRHATFAQEAQPSNSRSPNHDLEDDGL